MPKYNYKVKVKTESGSLDYVECELEMKSIRMSSTDGKKTWNSAIVELDVEGNLTGKIHIATIPDNDWEVNIDYYENGTKKKAVFSEDGTTKNGVANIPVDVLPN